MSSVQVGWGEIGRDHTTLVLHTNTLSLKHMPAEIMYCIGS